MEGGEGVVPAAADADGRLEADHRVRRHQSVRLGGLFGEECLVRELSKEHALAVLLGHHPRQAGQRGLWQLLRGAADGGPALWRDAVGACGIRLGERHVEAAGGQEGKLLRILIISLRGEQEAVAELVLREEGLAHVAIKLRVKVLADVSGAKVARGVDVVDDALIELVPCRHVTRLGWLARAVAEISTAAHSAFRSASSCGAGAERVLIHSINVHEAGRRVAHGAVEHRTVRQGGRGGRLVVQRAAEALHKEVEAELVHWRYGAHRGESEE